MSEQFQERLTITVPEASRRLGISQAAGYNAAKKGELPAIRVGGRVLILKAQFEAMINGEGPLTVRDRNLDEALTELLVAGGPLTQSLLGAGGVSPKPAPAPRKSSPRQKR